MKSYDQFLKENIRDKMTPKSLNDILKAIKQNGDSPLAYASYRGISKIVKKLIDEGENINEFDKFGFTPLMRAVDEDNYDVSHRDYMEVVRTLIKNGADINLVDKTRNMTALHYAVRRGNMDAVKTLLDNGANLSINIKDKWGKSPLDTAVSHNRKDIEKLLLEYLK